MPFVKTHLKELFSLFIALCIAFGVINIVSGLFMLVNYFSVQSQIALSAQYLNESLQSSQTVLNNADAFTNNATADVSLGSKNITSMLMNLSKNLTVISATFNNESNYFDNLNVPGQTAQLHQIGGAFSNVSGELNYTRKVAIPQLIRIVNKSAEQVRGPLTSINSSTAALSQSITVLLENAEIEVNSAGQGASFALLIFAVYLIMEGAIFILFGVLLRYI